MILKPPKGTLLNRGHLLARGLAACWLMNEGGGNIVRDLSGNGNNGVYTFPEWKSTPSGHGIRHDNDQYVTFPKKLSDYASNGLTIIWSGSPVQLTNSIRKFFFGQYQYNTTGYDLGLYINADYTILFYGSDGTSVKSSAAVTVGKYLTIAITYDKSKLILYHNGVYNSQADYAIGFTSNYPLHLGYTWVSTSEYANVITSYALAFNRALTASEIAYLYRNPFCMFEEDM